MGDDSPASRGGQFDYPQKTGRSFQRAVLKHFSGYRYERPEIKPMCVSRSPPPFAPHQNFVRSYLKGPTYPYGGLFLYHGAGTGKTCAAATIMSRFLYAFSGHKDNDWRVVWVTRRTLKGAVFRALFYDLCLPELRSKVLDNSTEMFGTKVGKRKMERLREAYAAFLKGSESAEVDALKSFRRRQVKKLPLQNIISYGDFVRALAKSKTRGDFGGALAHDMSRHKTNQGLAPNNDPLYQTLVIIDEAHNLFNRTDFNDVDAETLHSKGFEPKFLGLSSSSPSSKPSSTSTITGLQVIQEAIWASYRLSGPNSVKVVPLTATPMPTSPFDLLALLNLLIKDKVKRFYLPPTLKKGLDHYATKEGRLKDWVPRAFAKATNGLISYFSGENDPRYFAMKKWGDLIDISISQVTLDGLYRCKTKFPLSGSYKGRIDCYRRVATVAGLRGKMCTGEQNFRALTGQSKAQWEAREALKEAYRHKRDKALISWSRSAKPGLPHGPFVPPPKPKALLSHPPLVRSPKKALKSLECTKSYSFVLDSKAHPFSWKLLADNLELYSPKYFGLFKTIERLDRRDLEGEGRLYKHCIYCDTAGPHEGRSYGSKFAASVFSAKGYGMGMTKGLGRAISFVKPDLSSNSLAQAFSQSFCVLTSSRLFGQEKSDSRTRATLAAFNAKTNVHGKDVRFILIDDSFKEGIDLYDVKYFHFMEPPLTTATLRQAVARITRRCGSQGLPFGPQGWVVEVFMYRARMKAIKPSPGGNRYTTVYSVVKSLFPKDTLRAFRLLDEFERLAKGNAVDRLLNEAVINFNPPGRFLSAIKAGEEVIDKKVKSAR